MDEWTPIFTSTRGPRADSADSTTPEEDMERHQIHVLTAVTAQKAKSVIDPSTFSSWKEINTCDCTNKKTSRENTTKEIRSAPKRRTANSRRACRNREILDKGSPETLAQPNEERRIQESEPLHWWTGCGKSLEGELTKQSFLAILGTLHFFRVITGSQRW